MDILVNKNHPLNEDYIPQNLVEYTEYNGIKIDKKMKTLVQSECLTAFFQLQEDAKEENLYIIIDSAYRSFEYQKKVFENEVQLHGYNHAIKYVALPGTSEHQTALAIDIACYRNGEYTDNLKEDDPEIIFLINSAYKYGFILRYPKGKENITGYNYEFWHYRYVGQNISIYMHENNILTLEEYYERKKEDNMKQVKEFLYNTLLKTDVIIVATSTGPDSMALLHFMHNNYKDIKIICAHVNHKLRKQSDIEYEYIKKYCKENNIIFEGMEIATKFKSNIEENCRIARYDFLKSLKEKYNANYIMTAHHADDQMETILMRITRGSNLNGYAGLKLIDNYFLRPFLFITKSDILDYCNDNNIKYFLDRTNNSLNYTRNRFRKIIIPFLKKENSNVAEKFLNFSKELEEYDKFVNNYILDLNIIKDNTIDLKKFKKQTEFIQCKTVEILIRNIQKNNILNIQNVNVLDIIKLAASSKSNSKINLPNNFICKKEYDILSIEKEKKSEPFNFLFESSFENENWIIKKIDKTDEKSNNIIRLLSSEIKLPLYIRTRKEKDAMEVKNLGHKKVKDIFIDEKINIDDRNTYPILVDNEDNILWLPGLKKSKFDKDKNEKYDIILLSERKKTNDKCKKE